jgi:hypothetical protein
MDPLLTLRVNEPEFRILRDAYDDAFRRFVLAMNAHGDVGQAAERYRQTRDALAGFLLARRVDEFAVSGACCSA